MSTTSAVDPATTVRRARTNRIIVALVIMLIVPTVLGVGWWQYSRGEALAWSAHRTFSFGAPATVHLDKAGTYGVWAVPRAATDCTVTHDNQPTTVKPLPTSTSATQVGVYVLSHLFVAPAPGDYIVTCHSSSLTAYGMVSTPSPLVRIAFLLLGAILLGTAAFITGAILLGVALHRNARDRRTRPTPPYTYPAATYPAYTTPSAYPPQPGYAPGYPPQPGYTSQPGYAPPTYPPIAGAATPPVSWGPGGPPTTPVAPPWPPPQ